MDTNVYDLAEIWILDADYNLTTDEFDTELDG